MHAWVTGIITKAPRASVGKYLRHEINDLVEPEKSYALDYSDVVVFDFLVDGNVIDYP